MDNDSNDGFKTIKPAPFNRTPENTTAPISTNGINIKTLNVALGLSAMFVGLIIVIFFLPGWVERNKTTEPTNNGTVDTASRSSVTSSPESTTPSSTGKPVIEQFSAEEQARNIALRKEAQIHLQEILEKQKVLEENNAQVWAGKEYVTGLNHAKSGDALYNQQQFAGANQEYQDALAIFNSLTDKIEVIYKENIESGLNALDTGDSTLALTAFKTAALFTDESQQAEKGLERTQKLDSVFASIEQGNEAFNEGRLTEAKAAYQSALDLDPDTKLAQQKLQETNRLLANKQFNAFMSAGYLALDKHDFAAALTQFNKALTISPDSSAAKTAIQQTQYQAITVEIEITLKQASASEKNEQWQTAINLYDSALKLEKNLAEAQKGKQRAQYQWSINQRLEQILSHPERLSDKTIHAETTAYYNQIRQLDKPGPVLSNQLTKLDKLLQISATPVKIKLQSDNLTQVTVYKVGKLGMFEAKELSLRPGKYIAIGNRDGYRDVRIEFLVSKDTSNQAIHIAAKEKIN
ncbi:MAG: hypothetical protein DHS20C09_08600 [marine bacterium B5-7]|nr:MAG: hypothetical protein DHS20C09_08600 [marine bacterium B5-7]